MRYDAAAASGAIAKRPTSQVSCALLGWMEGGRAKNLRRSLAGLCAAALGALLTCSCSEKGSVTQGGTPASKSGGERGEQGDLRKAREELERCYRGLTADEEGEAKLLAVAELCGLEGFMGKGAEEKAEFLKRETDLFCSPEAARASEAASSRRAANAEHPIFEVLRVCGAEHLGLDPEESHLASLEWFFAHRTGQWIASRRSKLEASEEHGSFLSRFDAALDEIELVAPLPTRSGLLGPLPSARHAAYLRGAPPGLLVTAAEVRRVNPPSITLSPSAQIHFDPPRAVDLKSFASARPGSRLTEKGRVARVDADESTASRVTFEPIEISVSGYVRPAASAPVILADPALPASRVVEVARTLYASGAHLAIEYPGRRTFVSFARVQPLAQSLGYGQEKQLEIGPQGYTVTVRGKEVGKGKSLSSVAELARLLPDGGGSGRPLQLSVEGDLMTYGQLIRLFDALASRGVSVIGLRAPEADRPQRAERPSEAEAIVEFVDGRASWVRTCHVKRAAVGNALQGEVVVRWSASGDGEWRLAVDEIGDAPLQDCLKRNLSPEDDLEPRDVTEVIVPLRLSLD